MKIKISLSIANSAVEIMADEAEIDRLATVILKIEELLEGLYPNQELGIHDPEEVVGIVSVAYLLDGRKVVRMKVPSAPKFGLAVYPDCPGYELLQPYLERQPGDYDSFRVIPGQKKILKVVAACG